MSSKKDSRKSQKVWALLISVVVLTLLLSGCGGNSGADFFNGKTVTIIVPHKEGGGFDAYARMIAPYLQKYLPGSKVEVQNLSDEGGIPGRNQIYAANPDGLTLGFSTGPGFLFAEWAEQPNVQYKTTNFSWLGRINTEPHIMVLSARSKSKTMDDVVKAKQLTMGFSGVGSDDYYVALLTAKILGYQVEINSKFAGSNDANAACTKGDVDAVQTSYGTLSPLIDAKTVVPVVVFGNTRLQELPDVPTILELTTGDSQKTMQAIIGLLALDRVMFAPPGVPADRLKVLRDALDKVMADPAFIQTSVKLKLSTNYLTGGEVDNLIANIQAAQEQLKPLVKETSQGQ